MRDNVKRLGLEDLVMPRDPWPRVHVRAGGRLVGTCKRAMVIPGTLDQWRSWTGRLWAGSWPA